MGVTDSTFMLLEGSRIAFHIPMANRHKDECKLWTIPNIFQCYALGIGPIGYSYSHVANCNGLKDSLVHSIDRLRVNGSECIEPVMVWRHVT